MKKVYQTTFGAEGNCENACLASIFELNIDDIPKFSLKSDEAWNRDLDKWLRSRDLYRIIIKNNYLWVPSGYSIGVVSSCAQYSHAVVCKDGKIVWDPSFDQDSYDKPILEWEIFCLLNKKNKKCIQKVKNK